jgi:predicted dehydrogenase
MRALVFLEPGHFHAALTLRERHPLAGDGIAVYAAAEGGELDAFLALVAAFNARPARPTGWRPAVRLGPDPTGRLIAERPGDVVILAGRTDRKIGFMRRLHDAGFHVLADKPWLAGASGLGDVRRVLGGPPVAMEMMTGRHEVTRRVERMLAADPEVFGGFREAAGEPAIELESVHHLEKRVNGRPLRRPPWYFDVAVQGDGLADIPTHLVDHVQHLVGGDGPAAAPVPALDLVSARCWPTMVPLDAFARVTGLGEFPAALRAGVGAGGGLSYRCNAEIEFRCGGVLARAVARWDLTEPPGGGDMDRAVLRGDRADVRVERGPRTGWARRVWVEPRGDRAGVERALERLVAAGQVAVPGLRVVPAERGWEVDVPGEQRTGHEAHFALVLDDLLEHVARGAWPARRAAETLAKYELLARARALAEAGPGGPPTR